jgi:hypothetical protein
MKPRVRTRLIRNIEKSYMKNGQHLFLETLQVFENNSNDNQFDVFIKGGERLFEILNYETCGELLYPIQPKYFDGYITLKKFGQITKEDILLATRYFIDDILGMYLIFNISFKDNQETYNGFTKKN